MVRWHSTGPAAPGAGPPGPGARGRRGRTRSSPAPWRRSRAELALVVLLLQDPVPAAARIQALRLEQVLEGLGGGARQALAAVLQAQLLHPGLEDFGVLGVLRDDAVGGVPDAEAQGPPVAQGAHGHLGLVALGQQRGADAAQVLGPEVARLDAAGPGAPLGEGRHRGFLPVAAVEALVARGVVAVGDRPGRPVEVGVRLVAREGHGPVLLDRRLVGVQELAAAAHKEHGGAAPGAELPISRAVMPRCSQPLSQIASKSESTSGRGSCSSSASCLATQSWSLRASKALGRISEPL